MAFLSGRVGRLIKICRSNLPSLSKARLRMSTRLVDANMTTPSRGLMPTRTLSKVWLKSHTTCTCIYLHVHNYITCTCTCTCAHACIHVYKYYIYNLLNKPLLVTCTGRANDCTSKNYIYVHCHHYAQLTIHLHYQLVECVLLFLVALYRRSPGNRWHALTDLDR